MFTFKSRMFQPVTKVRWRGWGRTHPQFGSRPVRGHGDTVHHCKMPFFPFATPRTTFYRETDCFFLFSLFPAGYYFYVGPNFCCLFYFKMKNSSSFFISNRWAYSYIINEIDKKPIWLNREAPRIISTCTTWHIQTVGWLTDWGRRVIHFLSAGTSITLDFL